ncbi:MAG: hypothetical protein MUF36_00150 [Bacteroidales bacterium]|nr:hypothetical protein [Bacteroidales bacterium]
MSETTNSKNVRDDEIDLLDIFKRMGNSLGKMFIFLGRWLLISIVFILRNWLPLLVSIVLGGGASYLLRSTSAPIFISEMVLRTNTPPASDYIAHVTRLYYFCRDKNLSALMESLSINEAQARNIIDISVYWIIDRGADGIADNVDYMNKHDVHDTINVRMLDRMNIGVKVKNPQELHLIKKGIIQFIISDSLFQQRNRVRLKQNKELISRLEFDISQLDSLQKIKYFEETQRMNQPGNGQMVFLQEQKTQLIYEDIYDLLERKQSLEASGMLYKDIVTVLSDFSIPGRRKNGTLFYIKKVIPIFLGITFLILLFIHNRKRLKEIFIKY